MRFNSPIQIYIILYYKSYRLCL